MSSLSAVRAVSLGPPASPWLARVESWLWAKREFRMVPDLILPIPPAGAPSASAGPRVGFVGFPSDYSLAFLLGLLRSKAQLAGIATSLGANPAIAGENALSQVAEHMGVPLLRLARVNDYDSVVALERLRADLFLVASFDQILALRVLRIPAHGFVNVHPSLLPEYRGPEPIYWAIANGELESGISFQRVAKEIDTGPLLAQERTAILEHDTAGTLTRRVTEAGFQRVADVVSRAVRGDPGTLMDLQRGSYYTSVGHRRIDLVDTAQLAERLVRAGNPNMLAAAACGEGLTYVVKARLVDAGSADGGHRLHFPDGDLLIEETAGSCGCHHGEPSGSCPHDQ